MERYGFALPMDEAEAKVLIDFGGRNWIVWNTEFKREKIGEMPTEMFFHFFKSFSDAAKCNLNIECNGENEHHKIEAIFKAFAKAIRMAVKRDPLSNYLPSTKGVLYCHEGTKTQRKYIICKKHCGDIKVKKGSELSKVQTLFVL